MNEGAPSRRLLWPVAVVVGLTVLGAAAGVLWEVLWSPPTGVALAGEFVLDGPGNRDAFAGTASFVVIGAALGAVSGVVVGVLTRRDELLVLAAALLGGVLATVAMYAVGVALGPADPAGAAADAADLTPLADRLRVYGRGAWLALTGGVLVGLVTALLGIAGRGSSRAGAHAAGAPGTPAAGDDPRLDWRVPSAGSGPPAPPGSLGSADPAPPVGGR